MKTRRNILFITIIVTIISLIFVICLNLDSKGFQIALAFMGSSFISFMLELPNYISAKHENSNKLYYFLSDLKNQTMLLKNNIENHIAKFNIINDKIYDQNIEKIQLTLNNLKTFDSNYFILKKKNYNVGNIFNNITNAFNNLNLAVKLFSVNYSQKKLEILETENSTRNISPAELLDSLNYIITMCNMLIENIDKQAPILLPSKKLNQWSIDDLAIKNIINSFNINNN